MAWTDDEVAQIRAAVLALATGARVAKVSYAGPPARTVDYVPTDLAQLRALLADMEQSVIVAEVPPPRFRRVAFSKGFTPPRDSGE